MCGKTLLVSFFFLAFLTGCETTRTEALQTRVQAREQGLRAASISNGACDGVGQISTATSDTLSLEASAAPVK